MDKIYIVTAGEYSDYRIERVFLDETKARNYAKYHGTDFMFGMHVEEYEFDDENYELVTSGYWGITTIVKARKERGPRPFFTKALPITKADLAEKKKENKTTLILEDDLTIMITRYFPESVGEEKARAHTEKIAYDILAETNNHIVEGEDAEDVIDLMKEKWSISSVG